MIFALLLAWGFKLALRWVQYFVNTAKVAAFLPIKLFLGCLAWLLNWLAKGLAWCGTAPAYYSGSLQVEVLRLQAARQTELIANQAMEAQALQAMIAQLKDSRARAVQKCKSSQEQQRLLTESLQSALIQHQQHRSRVKAADGDAGMMADTFKSSAPTSRQASLDPKSLQLPPLPSTLHTQTSMDANGSLPSQTHLSGLNHLLHQRSSSMGGAQLAQGDCSFSMQSRLSADSGDNLSSSNGLGVGVHSKAARQQQQHQQQQQQQQQQQLQQQQQHHYQQQQQYHHQDPQPVPSKPRVAWSAHLGITLAAFAMRWLSDKEDEVAERLPASLMCEPVPTSMTRLLWWPVLALYTLWVLRLVGGGQVTSRVLACWGWAVLGYAVHGILALQQAEAKFARGQNSGRGSSATAAAAAAVAAAAAAGSKGAGRGGSSSQCDALHSGGGYGCGPAFEDPLTLQC